MQEIDWNDLRYCLSVVEEGSVTAAARALNVNQTTVSRRISSLESHLGKKLFDRSTSGWILTPVGESILPAARRMQDETDTIKRSVLADSKELRGTLRITAVDVCIQRILLPALQAFSEQYPDIHIEFLASEVTFDIAVHEADMAFRVTDDPPPNVVGTKLAEFAYGVYGHRDLIEKLHTDPASVAAISWMGDGESRPPWLQKSFPDMKIRYRSNSLNVIYDMIRNGHGIGVLPCGLGDIEPQLQRIECAYDEPAKGFWLLSHIDLRTTARIRIFRDYIVEAIQPHLPLLEGKNRKMAA